MTAALNSPQQKGADRSPPRPPAIVVDHVSKHFVLPHQRYSTLKERALHPVRTRAHDVLKAVDDTTFSVAQGEFFGIVGRNGSGKSTLMKVLAGIYEADSGTTKITGRLSPFIELGVGLNPEMTARENVLINAVMLGLSRREAKRRFDEIIAFAELEEFLDLKLKNYSSGMVVRLAFSVAIQVDADVLLIDEVLAVGDARFQQKCYDEFHRLKREGRTIVLVTHDMSAVERFCDRAMLVERGRLVQIGDPAKIARAYNELNFGRVTSSEAEVAPSLGGTVRIADAWFEDAGGGRTAEAAQDDPLFMCAEVVFDEPMDNPWFAMHLRNEARHVVFVTGSTMHIQESGTFAAGDRTVVRVGLTNWFAPGRYQLTPTVSTSAGLVLDLREDLASVVVHGPRRSGGVVELPHTFELSR